MSFLFTKISKFRRQIKILSVRTTTGAQKENSIKIETFWNFRPHLSVGNQAAAAAHTQVRATLLRRHQDMWVMNHWVMTFFVWSTVRAVYTRVVKIRRFDYWCDVLCGWVGWVLPFIDLQICRDRIVDTPRYCPWPWCIDDTIPAYLEYCTAAVADAEQKQRGAI